MQKNIISWFEIPVKDMARASKFYTNAFGVNIMPDGVAGPEFEMGIFEYSENQISGALIKGEGYEPCEKGLLIYMNAEPDIAACLDRVEAAGGKIVIPKFKISDEYGYIAYFYDTEGNKVGMHSSN
ncbi:VOC family protein [Pontibacter sp. SGAir0037]|uniref:VOC family protein n=1 Tax=Pontibacter sp. SGAir0037 TaxID=2571030 RepID=UPI0010CCCDEE|nr:VOC family protein [Pontibacter sp. SGAir0037]QCR23309.1 hypothetical protein C1N53_13820 [Pontibacter sp. SGAir0037]